MDPPQTEKDREARLYNAFSLLSKEGYLNELVYDRMKTIDLNFDFD